MATKLYDLAVKTGEYTDQNGQVKGRYENVGAVMESVDQQGNKNRYMMLKRTFNPAGVPNPDNRDSLLVSMFKPKDDQQQPQTQRPAPAPARPAQPAPAAQTFEDDIPF